MNAKTNTFAALPATRANKLIDEIRKMNQKDRASGVFAARSEVIRQGLSTRAELVAEMMYKASRAPKEERELIFNTTWSYLERHRDNDLRVGELVTARFDLSKYNITELGVYGFRAQTVVGDSVRVAAHSKEEFVRLMGENSDQRQLLVNWGRGLAFKSQSHEAASLATNKLLKARKESIKRLAQYAQETVEFDGGQGATWSVDTYEAVLLARAGEDVKPGKLLRGVTDLIKEAISSAWYAQSMANNEYIMAFIAEGKQTASGILYPREGGRRQHVSADADKGREAYAGAEPIVLQFQGGKRVVVGGAEVHIKDLQEAIDAARESYAEFATEMLETAEQMMACYQGDLGIKENEVDHFTFASLKQAMEERLTSRQKERKEFRATQKIQLQALNVLDVAMSLDIVNRRRYLKGFEEDGQEFAGALAWAIEVRKAERERNQIRAEQAEREAAQEAKREAEYARTAERALQNAETKAQRDAERAAYARAAAELDAELAAARKGAK